ncbi:MAG: phosphatidylglycerophosphatase A [Balneolales bacterium]|nr:phosphatidylglycerophosphatase A [Balneolales bacterium]
MLFSRPDQIPVYIWLVGTGFGSGLIPKAPGTTGSLAALLHIFLILSMFGAPALVIFFILCVAGSLLTSPYFEKNIGKDPSCFVMDEWAGQTIPFFIFFVHVPENGKAETLLLFLLSFIFFRAFDILKPFGIKRAEKLKPPAGILADDLLAGVYALICIKMIIFVAG